MIFSFIQVPPALSVRPSPKWQAPKNHIPHGTAYSPVLRQIRGVDHRIFETQQHQRAQSSLYLKILFTKSVTTCNRYKVSFTAMPVNTKIAGTVETLKNL